MWPSPTIPSARWLRGARSPLAPTVPLRGMYGRQEAAGGGGEIKRTGGEREREEGGVGGRQEAGEGVMGATEN